jgi:arylsulfatase A-like enzyme
MTKNVLFIMCDQLRFDYLSCNGHPTLKTPNIDWLASRGVNFTKAYVQATVCGPSRMSAYTGRYMRSHGSTHNGVPLRVGEPTLGDHLRDIGVRTVLVGKTHMVADEEGMERLGIDPTSIIGVHTAQCGFEPYDRDDGLRVREVSDFSRAYDRYLRERGYGGDNPWHEWANAGEASDGSLQSGWLLAHADKPTRVKEEDSETPYMTRRAMDFMREAKVSGQPWCLHLSFIKPHWPYIVPAPYNDLYSADDVLPANRSGAELQDPHTIYGAFAEERFSKVFSDEAKRRHVIPAYMGLIKQVDDQMGLLFSFMRDEGLLENTMIVFTSDHGDYLGDHWLGEKYLFHQESVRVPMIICDPSRNADATRGTTCDRLVEMIDLAPTFLEYFGGGAKPHILEGRSLMNILHGKQSETWRDYAFSEFDYAFELARVKLDTPVVQSRLFMVTDGRWKYISAEGFRPMLYDLASDPRELTDLGGQPEMQGVCEHFEKVLSRWMREAQMRITMPDTDVTATDEAFKHFDVVMESGVMIGYWDEKELAQERRKMDEFNKARTQT